MFGTYMGAYARTPGNSEALFPRPAGGQLRAVGEAPDISTPPWTFARSGGRSVGLIGLIRLIG